MLLGVFSHENRNERGQSAARSGVEPGVAVDKSLPSRRLAGAYRRPGAVRAVAWEDPSLAPAAVAPAAARHACRTAGSHRDLQLNPRPFDPPQHHHDENVDNQVVTAPNERANGWVDSQGVMT